MSEQFLNGTSAQLGYTAPFTFDVPKENYISKHLIKRVK